MTREVRIGRCRARRIAAVGCAGRRDPSQDPKALLCDDEDYRYGAAHRQRLAHLSTDA